MPNPTLDIIDVMVIIRRDNLKYGFYERRAEIARMSASSLARAGTTASRDHAFTDIDANLSLDLSIKGHQMGRPDDVIGIGGR